jgi:hypothetical protein
MNIMKMVGEQITNMAKTAQNEIYPFNLVTEPKGYFAKREITNQDFRALIKGSKNIIINDGDKWSSRLGYILDGQAKTVNQGIDSSFDFISKQGTKVLRAFQGDTAGSAKLQVRTEYTSGTAIYTDLLDTLNYSDFNYTTWWYDTEVTRCLIFVDGTTSIRMWGGGLAYIASNTGTTITKSGTKTWAEEGFFISHASRSVRINGIDYTYTGGESTTTLTGLTGLPVFTAGTPVMQTVVTVTSLTGVSPAITPNLIATRDNQVIYGSTKTSVVWGSKNTDYKDCGFTTPLRIPGEGFKFFLDNNTVGFTQDDDNFFIFAGRDDLYKINFILTSTATSVTENITTKKLRTGAGQSAISQSAIIPVKNGIMYFTNEKTLTWLTSIENVFTPQSVPISDAIKDDFDSYDLTGVSGIFWGNAVWIAIPQENLVYIYDFDKALWQTPQTIPVSRFSIIDNILYGHSNSSNETYKLNTGTDDNGVIIEFIAAFAYRNYGDRNTLKEYDEYYTEAYLSPSTILKTTHYYDYQGYSGIIETELDGSDKIYEFSLNKDVSLGKDNLGKNPLGSSSIVIPNLTKYRVIDTMKVQDFFEHQIIYSSDSENAQFELIAHGPNVRASTNLPTDITR